MTRDPLALALDDLAGELPPLGGLPDATVHRAVRRRRRSVALVGAAAVVLVGGAAGLGVAATGGPSSEGLVPGVTPSSAPTPAPTTAPPVAPTSGPDSAPPAGAARVVLAPDGLGLASGSSTSRLELGVTPAASVRSAVNRALGAGTATPLPDCGAEVVAVQHSGLTLYLDGARFVGWVTDRQGLTTGDGLGVGASLVELRDALPGVEVTQGTLGTEWSVPSGLAGFLSSSGPGAQVTGLRAGQTCPAR